MTSTAHLAEKEEEKENDVHQQIFKLLGTRWPSPHDLQPPTKKFHEIP
jgi:hypothetical protein